MAGKVISIEIGYSLTRVCEVDYKSKAHRVYKSFTIPTMNGVINDGALMITPEYADALKKALAENKMKSKQVMFTITSAKIASREVVIPFVKENRIADVVNANASDYFPVDLSQYQLAYSILGVIGETKGTQQYKLLVMAAPIALLSGYYDLAKALKLEIVAIDYAGNSVYQVVKEECAQGTNLIVKIDERSTLLMVVQNGVLVFTRNVAYGVEEAIDTVMESRQWGDIERIEQALQIMAQNDCVMIAKAAEENMDYLDDPQEEELGSKAAEERAQQAVTAALLPLTGGIARVIDYYVSHNANTPVDRVIITGLGANIRGMADLLAREINHSVEVLRQAAGWSLEKNFKQEWYGEYIACVGGAVAPLGFKKEAEKGKKREGGSKSSSAVNGTFIAWFLLVLGLIVSIVLIAGSLVRYMGLQKTNVELKAQSSELEEIIPIYNEYVETLAAYNTAVAMYAATENRNEELVDFLEEFENKMPSDVHVVSFTSTIEGVAINMNVSTKTEVAAAIEQLRTFESLQSASVTVTSVVEDIDEDAGVTSVSFSVAALYKDIQEDDTEE